MVCITKKVVWQIGQGVVGAGACVLYALETVYLEKAVVSAFEFGKYCNALPSDQLIPQLGNITCTVLESTVESQNLAQLILSSACCVTVGILGLSMWYIKSTDTEEQKKLVSNTAEEL